jgi:transcriptional regulator with XRE-family HTH domain
MRTLTTVCYAIKQARVDRHLTQKELAEKAHVSRAWIIALEKGHARGAEFGKVMDVIAALHYDIKLAPSRQLTPAEEYIMEHVFNV